MKISILDSSLICSGFIYGTSEIFIEQKRWYSNKISGILSFIISPGITNVQGL